MAKKHIPARATAYPESGEEALKMAQGLGEKYPQMYKPGWGVAKAIKRARKKTGKKDMKGGTPFRSVMEHRRASHKALNEAMK